jgi:hypothetical protein
LPDCKLLVEYSLVHIGWRTTNCYRGAMINMLASPFVRLVRAAQHHYQARQEQIADRRRRGACERCGEEPVSTTEVCNSCRVM